MVLLAQTSFWLIAPLVASANSFAIVNYVESQFDVPVAQVNLAPFYPHWIKIIELPPTHSIGLDIGEAARPKWDASVQVRRIKEMGINGTIYFDAPSSSAPRRIWR